MDKCNTYGKISIKTLVARTQKKSPLGRLTCRWENIIIHLQML